MIKDRPGVKESGKLNGSTYLNKGYCTVKKALWLRLRSFEQWKMSVKIMWVLWLLYGWISNCMDAFKLFSISSFTVTRAKQ